MRTSDQINELAAALAIAQGAIEGAAKDKTNPHFKSSYADLASVWEACREHLAKNGLSVVQPVVKLLDGPTVLVTRLLHRSGQWIEDGGIPLLSSKEDMQGLGSALTYARRYGLMAMVGIAPEDDDGNAATSKPAAKPEQAATKPSGYDAWLLDMEAVVDLGSDALKKSWMSARLDLRQHLTKTDNAKWERMKEKAAKVKVEVPA